MTFDTLVARLQQANKTKTYCEISRWCGLSHQTIRLMLIGSTTDIKISTYYKIDKGLKQNGF